LVVQFLSFLEGGLAVYYFGHHLVPTMLTKRQKAYLVLKRFIDIVGSLLGLIVLSPLMIVVWFITLCTEGAPVLFRQKRIGKNEKPFTLYKFRSMKKTAKQVAPSDISVQEQKQMETEWGRFMRKTSIDELPQLFNILFGQMSFIGPRPSQGPEIEPDLIQARRSYVPSAYLVRPGLGGYAQVYMKRDHDPHQKAYWDSVYVQHLSLWLDMKMFFWSFLCLFGYERGR
jgi:O-antigen biosynthesis protein WbqP